MKDVTITITKLDKNGYQMSVNDDDEGEANVAGEKANDSFFTPKSKEEVQSRLNAIVSALE
jgi:hypothetical protein